MPDRRRHRGPHPGDAGLFGQDRWKDLAAAVNDLSWLLSRGYAAASSLKIVGDRYGLTRRQRIAVSRVSCSDEAVERRASTQVEPGDVCGRTLEIDGFNLLTSIEAALAGGVILIGRDGCYRDMASMHGSYRKVEETRPAIELIGGVLDRLDPASCLWYFDRPISNSGRISALIRASAEERDRPWDTEIVNDPDAVLRVSENIVATADSEILDSGPRWLNLARIVIDAEVPHARIPRLA